MSKVNAITNKNDFFLKKQNLLFIFITIFIISCAQKSEAQSREFFGITLGDHISKYATEGQCRYNKGGGYERVGRQGWPGSTTDCWRMCTAAANQAAYPYYYCRRNTYTKTERRFGDFPKKTIVQIPLDYKTANTGFVVRELILGPAFKFPSYVRPKNPKVGVSRSNHPHAPIVWLDSKDRIVAIRLEVDRFWDKKSDAYNALVEMYGDPARTDTYDVATRRGDRYKQYDYHWDVGDVEISLNPSIASNGAKGIAFSEGYLRVTTKSALRTHRAYLEGKHSQ
ncbi:MAG: hypothetical protein AAGJ87_01860 [Pseudomonadota bacterium]